MSSPNINADITQRMRAVTRMKGKERKGEEIIRNGEILENLWQGVAWPYMYFLKDHSSSILKKEANGAG